MHTQGMTPGLSQVPARSLVSQTARLAESGYRPISPSSSRGHQRRLFPFLEGSSVHLRIVRNLKKRQSSSCSSASSSMCSSICRGFDFYLGTRNCFPSPSPRLLFLPILLWLHLVVYRLSQSAFDIAFSSPDWALGFDPQQQAALLHYSNLAGLSDVQPLLGARLGTIMYPPGACQVAWSPASGPHRERWLSVTWLVSGHHLCPTHRC